MLIIDGVCKTYQQTALLPTFLTLAAGECVAVVGESGSGKSTFLQIVAGFLPSDAGEMLLRGKRLPTLQSMLVRGYPDIQLVPQNFQLLPHHRAWEQITLPIRHYPKAHLQARLAYLAALLGLETLLERYPRELSGGQQQRVAIARALANSPEVLLLDEPFNQADMQTKMHLEKAFFALKNSNTALLLVTHDAPQALELADKVLVLQAGKTLQSGTPHEIYQNPLSEYIARLFGGLNRLSERVAIRPEYCYVSASPTAHAGKVLQSYYQGHRYRHNLQLETGEEWELYTPERLEIGTSFFIDFEESRCLYF